MENSKQFNTTAIRLFHFNEVSTALLDITLNREKDENGYTRHSVFFGMTAGESNGQGGRAFNKEKKITMKIQPQQVYELKTAIEGFFNMSVLKLLGDGYTIFTDPSKSGYGGGSKKTLSVKPVAANPERNTPYSVCLNMNSGDLKASIFLTYTKALALANVFKKLVDVYLEDLRQVSVEEGKNMSSKPGYSRENNYSTHGAGSKNVSGPFDPDMSGSAPTGSDASNENMFGFGPSEATGTPF